MVDLRHGQWGETGDNPGANLDRMKRLLSMEVEPTDVGWSPEPARLFSIDVAMLALRRVWDSMDVSERSELSDSLQEARRMAVEGNDDELGYLQTTLERYLTRSPSRTVWLTALNALLPCPFRAAEATLRAALELDDAETESFVAMLRQRLQARLGEGMLMLESDIFATV